MSVADIYKSIADLPPTVPVFPLTGVLLLPRGQLPLNIFEERYLAMVNDALSGSRLIGMIQPQKPDADMEAAPALQRVGSIGRLTAFSETDDRRILITLTGVCRFEISEELDTTTPYRQCRLSYGPFEKDLVPRHGEDAVDRKSVLATFRRYLEAHQLEADWESVENTSNEALVNSLSMMSPYGPQEKQALLEAPDLKTRAEILVALTEMNLAKTADDSESRLQ